MSTVLDPYHGPWTAEEFLALPESDLRMELQDGCILVNASPIPPHQYCASRLVVGLTNQLPPALAVLGDVDTQIQSSTVRRPDVLVIRPEVLETRRKHLDASDVVLAIEIVSPSSIATDRLLKPAEYAAAGIAGFWRVELEPHVSLSAFVLREGSYVELGSWGPGESAHITEPVDVNIRVDDLAWPGRS